MMIANGKPRPKPMEKPSPYIPERLFQKVQLHIMRCLTDEAQPLMLGIQGKPGVGKTFGVQQILRQLRVREFLISSGQLESGEAGRPAQLIRSSYLAAGRTITGDPKRAPQPAALVLNDVDVGLGDWGERVQTTVNRQTVIGELMHLADFPDHVANRPTRPVPMILTGNNFGTLYRPLIRTGRMALLNWELKSEEQLEVVHGIFPELAYEEIVDLVAVFSREPVVFFSEIRRCCRDQALLKATAKLSPAEAVRMALVNPFDDVVTSAVTLDRVMAIGRQLRRESTVVNHLKETNQ